MFSYFRKVAMVSLCLGLLLGFVSHNPVNAADPLIFNVNTTDDGADFATNSVCSVGHITDGPCTLRAALSEAYWNLEYQDIIINLNPETYLLTIPPDLTNKIHTGDLDIPDTTFSNTITITTNDPQNRAVIDGNQLDRVFRIGEGVHIVLENLVVRGGLLLSSTVSSAGGAGIKNEGNLKLYNVIIEDNVARCKVDGCTTYIVGGAILNYGDIIMSRLTIQNNSSPSASAIFNTVPGRIVISNSTIANNHATDLWSLINYAYLHIGNSTISDNTGGNTESNFVGIANYGTSTLVIQSSTFANEGRFAGVYNSSEADVTLKDSIFMALPAPSGSNFNTTGTWTSLGYNIFSDATFPSTSTGDLINTDPLLGYLGAWGGPTMTKPLKPGSPAIDHRPGDCEIISNPLYLSIGTTLKFDQRYFDRNDGLCDTGAFEGIMENLKIFLPLLIN